MCVSQLGLFDKVVISVLLYGCEVWSVENVEIVELFHLKILKHIIIFKQQLHRVLLKKRYRWKNLKQISEVIKETLRKFTHLAFPHYLISLCTHNEWKTSHQIHELV